MATTDVFWGAIAEVNSGNMTLVPNNNVVAGDLLIANIAYRSNAAFTPPVGWTTAEVSNSGNTIDSATTSISSLLVAWKLAEASDLAGVTFTRVGGSNAIGRLLTPIGVNKADPYDKSNITLLAAASTDIASSAGLTPIEAGEFLSIFVSAARIGSITDYDADGLPPIDQPSELYEWETEPGDVPGVALGSAGVTIDDTTATGILHATVITSARHVIAAALWRMAPSVSITPSVRGAKANRANPTVKLGSLIAEDNVTAESAVVAPTVLFGSTVATGVAEATGDVAVPLVATSSVAITPAEAAASGIVVPPTITAELIAAPSPAQASGETLIEDAEIGFGPLFSPDLPLSNVWTPQEPLE